jgi:succinate-acetate transporter protein
MSENLTRIQDTTANPAPLGLLGFGMTTVLLNLHNAGLYGLDSMVLAMGIFYGGIAQVIAGIMEWRKNNTFGTTAFISYGMFWLTLVALLLMSRNNLWTGYDATSFGTYLLLWGVFTAFMFVGTLRLNRALQVVFGSLVVLFFLLAAGNYAGSDCLKRVAGYEGVFCGLSAVYAGVAQVLNEVYGRTVLPLGAPKPRVAKS